MDHLKLIDEKIAHYESELNKLRNAREVLIGLSADKQAAEQTKAKPAAKKKAKSKTNGASKASASDNGVTVRHRVTEALQSASDPMTSADLIVALGMTDKKQPVYTALSSMAAAGEVQKDDQKRYSLAAANA